MDIYITKDKDGIVKAFYGKKPKLNMNGIYGPFWEIPLSEWDDTCGYDVISENGAYYYSNVLLKLFEGIAENMRYDDPPMLINIFYSYNEHRIAKNPNH